MFPNSDNDPIGQKHMGVVSNNIQKIKNGVSEDTPFFWFPLHPR